VEDVLKDITDIESIKNEGMKESNTVDFLVEAKNNADVRESIFNAFSKAGMPILMLKPENLTLEEIFLEVTEKAEEEVTNASDI
jgi:ABC-2 type transport system ATP-binding protein